MKVNAILIGGAGSGKSYSIRTLAQVKETFVLATEPGFEHTIHGRGDDEDLTGRLHYKYVAPASTSWDTMIKHARNINSLSNEVLQKMQGMNKSEYGQFIEILSTCSDFVCDCCGKSWGAIDDWGDDRAFVVDGLTGCGIMSMDLTVGSKPIKTQPDWGVAMDNLERLVTKWCCDTKCTFVLISHLEREHDEITGGTQLMVSTLGRKLAPKIPRFFDEVILCQREGKKFHWSTAAMNIDLKTRLLPIADEITPDFSQLFEQEKK